jgi:hypothetical protein
MGEQKTTSAKHHHMIIDDFSLRVLRNLRKELLASLRTAQFIGWLLLAIGLGVALFIAEFKLVKVIFAFLMPPVFIYLVGTYLTLLPSVIVITITIISLVSLSLSEQGSNIESWFAESFVSYFEWPSATASSTITQKLIGFVTLSAIASLLLVFFI